MAGRVGLLHGTGEARRRRARPSRLLPRRASRRCVFYATTRRPAIQPEPGPSPSPIRTVVLITIDTAARRSCGRVRVDGRPHAGDGRARRPRRPLHPGVRHGPDHAAVAREPSHRPLPARPRLPPQRHEGGRRVRHARDGAASNRAGQPGPSSARFPSTAASASTAGSTATATACPAAPTAGCGNERPGQRGVDEALEWIRGIERPASAFYGSISSSRTRPTTPIRARGTAGRSQPASVRYDDEVARADGEVGRLLAGLGERAASALVIVAGDHGEAFGEHGEIAHSVFLYDTTLRVPLIIAGPGFGAGRARRRRVARGCPSDGA